MQTQTTSTTRKNSLFPYMDANDEPAYFSHAELIALRAAYVKAFPDMKDDVWEDESLFNPRCDSDLRQQMAEWNEDR